MIFFTITIYHKLVLVQKEITTIKKHTVYQFQHRITLPGIFTTEMHKKSVLL